MYSKEQAHRRCDTESFISIQTTGGGIAQKRRYSFRGSLDSDVNIALPKLFTCSLLIREQKPRVPTAPNTAQATREPSCLHFLWVHDFFIWAIGSLSAIGRMECDPIPV